MENKKLDLAILQKSTKAKLPRKKDENLRCISRPQQPFEEAELQEMKAMGKNTAKISCFQKNQKIMLTLLRESAKLLESRKKTEKDTRPTYSNDVYT